MVKKVLPAYSASTGHLASISDAADNFTELYGGVMIERLITLHASKLIWNLAKVPYGMTVTAINVTVDTAQGGALTATLVKATGTAAPAAATTPLHIALAIDLNAAANTNQSIALTVTGADLVLAAGDRIALVLNAALTVGSALVTIVGTRT